MNVLFRFLTQFFYKKTLTRAALRKRSLAFETLRRRDMLAADLTPVEFDGPIEVAEIVDPDVDDAMIGGIEDPGRGDPGKLSPVEVVVGDKIKRFESGLSGLNSLESYSASYGGYGGDAPDLSGVDVQFASDEYTVTGNIADDDLTNATISINGVSVAANADPATGHFQVVIAGTFQEQVDVIVTDLDGNTDVETVSAD